MERLSPEHSARDQADVFLFPPLVGATLMVSGIILHALFPFHITDAVIIIRIAGIVILLGGISLQVICLQAFKRAKTTPLFKKPSTHVLQSGPYARSRNPIYIAVFLQFSGLALLVNSWWLILALPVLYVYLRFGVIAREERYLEQKFGDEYRAYRSQVPRWL